MNQLFLFRQEMTPIRKLLLMHLAAGGKLVEYTATGNPLTFVTDVVKPLVSLTLPFTPIQSGSGDPYPPGGGKNMCPPTPFERGQYSNGVWAADVARITTDYIPIEPHTNYMISVDADNTANISLINYNIFDSNKTWLGSRSENGEASFNGDKTHLLNSTFENTAFVRITIRDATNSLSSLNDKTLADADLMLEKGSSVTTFAPYSNIRPISGISSLHVYHSGEDTSDYDTITVTFPASAGTVYGGSLNLTTGVLTATYMGKVYNGSQSEEWAVTGSGNFACKNDDCKKDERNIIPLCDKFTMEQTYASAYPICPVDSKDFASDVTEWKTWLATNPIQVVYILASPVVVATLSPTQITAMLGDNTIWSDTNGTNSATYLKKG